MASDLNGSGSVFDEGETDAVHIYIEDMAIQLSQLAARIGNSALSQHLRNAASVARDIRGQTRT